MSRSESGKYHFYGIEFYPERGLVTVTDTKKAADATVPLDKHTRRMSPGQFMKHAIGAFIAECEARPSEKANARRMLDAATAVAKTAKKQGDPTDPKVLSHAARHRRKSSIITPSEANRILGPVGGERYRLDFSNTNTSEVLFSGPTVKPDFSISMSDPQVITPQRGRRK